MNLSLLFFVTSHPYYFAAELARRMTLRTLVWLMGLISLFGVRSSVTRAAAPMPTLTVFTDPANSAVISSISSFPCGVLDSQWIGYSQSDLVVLGTNGHVYVSRDDGIHWACLTGAFVDKEQPSRGIVASMTVLWENQPLLVVSSADFSWLVDSGIGAGSPAPISIVGPLGLATSASNVVFRHLWPHPTRHTAVLAIMDDPRCEANECDSMLLATGLWPEDTPLFAWRVIAGIPHAVTAQWATTPTQDPRQLDFFVIARPGGPQDVLTGVLLLVPGTDAATIASASPVDYNKFCVVKLDKAVGFFKRGNFFFVATVVVDETSAEGPSFHATLYLSSDNMASLQKAEFPTSPGDDHTQDVGFLVTDVRDNVFVNVFRKTVQELQSGASGQLWGATYLSGLHGGKYTLSLPHTRRVMRDGRGAVDFHRLDGLDGIIFANVVLNAQVPSCRHCTRYEECELHCRFGTVVSSDNGKTWQRVAPPPQLCPGDAPTADCSLHLHGVTSTVHGPYLSASSIFSSATAPGLLMAHGNVGSSLDTNSLSLRSVFMSRDGGRTWTVLATDRKSVV